MAALRQVSGAAAARLLHRHLKLSLKLGCERVGTKRLVWVGEGRAERSKGICRRLPAWFKAMAGWVVASALAGYLVGLAGVWWVGR